MFLERGPGSEATWWYVVFAKIQDTEDGPDEPCFDLIGHLAPISRETFPALAQAVDPLLETHKCFVTGLDLVKMGCFVGEVWKGPGRPQEDRTARWPVSASPRLCGIWRRPAIRETTSTLITNRPDVRQPALSCTFVAVALTPETDWRPQSVGSCGIRTRFDNLLYQDPF